MVYIAINYSYWPTFLPLIVWVYIYSFSRNYVWKSNSLNLKLLVQKPSFTWNSHSRSFWVIHFAISHRGSISSYNIAGLISEVSEEVATPIAKIAVVNNPTLIWGGTRQEEPLRVSAYTPYSVGHKKVPLLLPRDASAERGNAIVSRPSVCLWRLGISNT